MRIEPDAPVARMHISSATSMASSFDGLFFAAAALMNVMTKKQAMGMPMISDNCSQSDWGSISRGELLSFLIDFQRVVVDTIVRTANGSQEVHASLCVPEIQHNLDLSIAGDINRLTRALSDKLRTGLVL